MWAWGVCGCGELAFAVFESWKAVHFSGPVGGLRSEVRGQNAFMKKLMMIHAVTMLLLLAGMFGLSTAAMELSKETKVGAEGTLVTAGRSAAGRVHFPGFEPSLRRQSWPTPVSY